MERKSRTLTAHGPYESERLQLAAYCLLLEEHTGQPVRRGRLEYLNRTLDVPFDAALAGGRPCGRHSSRRFKKYNNTDTHDVRRSHASAARCRGCGFRRPCSQSLSA